MHLIAYSLSHPLHFRKQLALMRRLGFSYGASQIREKTVNLQTVKSGVSVRIEGSEHWKLTVAGPRQHTVQNVRGVGRRVHLAAEFIV